MQQPCGFTGGYSHLKALRAYVIQLSSLSNFEYIHATDLSCHAIIILVTTVFIRLACRPPGVMSWARIFCPPRRAYTKIPNS